MEPEIVQTAKVTTATIRDTIPTTELAGFLDRSLATVTRLLEQQSIAVTGPAFAHYFRDPGDTLDVEVGFPAAATLRATDDAVPSSLPACRVVRAVHHGSHDRLRDSWRTMWEWIVHRGLDVADDMWELYLTDPAEQTDPAMLRTELNWPLRG